MNTALFSFFGIIIGASLQYLFTRHLDNQKYHRELRTKAYTDYLRCVSEQVNLDIQQRQSQEGRELNAKIADAKCRICLYGSAAAIKAFADFERLGANTINHRGPFTDMVEIMRRDSTKGGKADPNDLEVVLLGLPRDA